METSESTKLTEISAVAAHRRPLVAPGRPFVGMLLRVQVTSFCLSVSLPVQLYPGGGSVVKLMETLSDWLLSLPLQRIPYQAVLDLVDNKMRVRHTHTYARTHTH